LFEEVFGIPAHPLLVHAAVVFVPVQILTALGYAFVPFARRLIAWLVVALAVVAPLTAVLAKLSGDAFQKRLISRGTAGPPLLAKIAEHSGYGNRTLYFSIGLSVAMVLLMVVQVMRSGRPASAMAASTAAADTEKVDAKPAKGPIVLAAVLTILVLAVSVGTGYYVFKTGDSGAHMVWTGM
jgi:hypothetical protein